MLYTADDVSHLLNEKIKLLDETLNAFNEKRVNSKSLYITILIIIAIISLCITCKLFSLHKTDGCGVVFLFIVCACVFICLLHLNFKKQYTPMSKTDLEKPDFISSLDPVTRKRLDKYFAIKNEINEISNINDKLLVSKKTCPKCGTSILAEAIYVGENNDNIYMYNCPQCHYEFRENMHVGEQSIKIGASV